jgi:hypothetical protein
MLAAKPMFERGNASYIATKRRTASLYAAFGCFFGGIALMAMGFALSQ